MTVSNPNRGGRTFPREVLVSLLKQGLGQHVAESLFTEAATRLKLGPDEFSEDEALHLFEEMAKSPGLPGIAARFAKSRLCLLPIAVSRG
jgi:hypothetical protein